MKIRVMIVDDSVIACKILSETLSNDPDIEVVGTALSGPIALIRLGAFAPDLVVLDLDMPVMDGLQTLFEIKKMRPKLPVIICSALVAPGNRYAMKSLLGGATDCVSKPTLSMNGCGGLRCFSNALLGMIKSIVRSKRQPRPDSTLGAALATPLMAAFSFQEFGSSKFRGIPEILAIGVSTGGPQALAKLLPELPSDFPAPIVIVQHMPPLFTKSLSESIGSKSRIKVGEGFEGCLLEPGKAWIAPGGSHMKVVKRKRGYELSINSDDPVNSCRPSVDVLFRSVVGAFKSKVLAVVLTGMGQDGLGGAEAVRRAGGSVLVQDEASSVVWGMPGIIAKAGLADKIVSLQDLPMEIRVAFSRSRPVVDPLEPLSES